MTEFRPSRPADQPVLTRIWQLSFGDPLRAIQTFFDTGYAPRRSRVAVVEGQIAAMLFWFDCRLGEQNLAYLYAVATDPAFRGRGIASALLSDTHRQLIQEGYAAAVLSPGEDSLVDFYRPLGYVLAGCREMLPVCARTPVPVVELTPAEFAIQRRRLLPPNGLVQEGENLAYLHRYARFFAGDGFLAAVDRSEPILWEFLGEKAQLPGPVAALGLPGARRCAPGGRIPHVMALWFAGEPPRNLYLGFHFE